MNEMNTIQAMSLRGGKLPRHRVGYIDALKGFAGLCVVLGHVIGGYISTEISPAAIDALSALHDAIYSFHMPLYFMISGYVYSRSYFSNDSLPKWKKLLLQVGNLIVVYILYSECCGISKLIFSRYVNQPFDPGDLLKIWSEPIEVFWYLYVLIEFYLLFSLVQPGRRNLWAVLGMCGALNLCSQFVAGPFQIGNILSYSVYFCAGIALQEREEITDNGLLAVGGAVAALVILCLTWKIERLAIARLPVALGISGALWYAFKHFSVLGNIRFLQCCGRYSLELYIAHTFLHPLFRAALLMTGIHNPYVGASINFVSTVALSLFGGWACKKLRLSGLLFKPVSFVYVKVHGSI